MDLFRIMLVDDEEEVRASIIKKIDWNSLGFEVVGDAENGEEAFEMVEALEPDVVLTDIRMPYMDGLVLSEKIFQYYPSIKIVIFSGFDEFEYAKKALHLNVIEYILKPVNVEELSAILLKIKNNLDNEIQQKRDVRVLREKFQKSLPLIKQHFLDDLVHGRVESNTISESLQYYEIPIDHAESWLVASLFINKPSDESSDIILPLHKEQELIFISVKQILEETLNEFYRFESFRSSHGLCIIAAIDENNTIEGLIELLNDFCRKCKKILQLSIVIGVGNTYKTIEALTDSYRESNEAIGYKSIMGEENVIYISDVEPNPKVKLIFDSKIENDLINAIKFGRTEEVIQNVGFIAEQMASANVHMSQYQAYIIHFMNTITQLIQRYELDIFDILGNENDYFQILTSLKSSEDLKKWLNKTCLYIHDNIYEKRDNTTRDLIRQAKEYIMGKYQDPELSGDMVCQQLHISCAYFSTIFKKETGQSYVAYLTELRLDKAVELLNQTEEKTYVIALKVGYLEANYFSYVFKKKFGVSPNKFRGR